MYVCTNKQPPSVRENEIMDLKPLGDIHFHFFEICSICDGPKTLAPLILFILFFLCVTLGTLGHIISLSIEGMRLATLILFGGISGPDAGESVFMEPNLPLSLFG